jgi:hypothetical protein
MAAFVLFTAITGIHRQWTYFPYLWPPVGISNEDYSIILFVLIPGDFCKGFEKLSDI